MRFCLFILGTELFSFEFAYPGKGVYPVPDWIPSELDLEMDLNYEDLPPED